jgi:hypothetical protein
MDKMSPERRAQAAAEARVERHRAELAEAMAAEREANSALGEVAARGGQTAEARATLRSATERVVEAQAALPHLEEAARQTRKTAEIAEHGARVARLRELKELRVDLAGAFDDLLTDAAAMLERMGALSVETGQLAREMGNNRYNAEDYVIHWLGSRLGRLFPGKFAPAPPVFDLPLAKAEAKHLEALVP